MSVKQKEPLITGQNVESKQGAAFKVVRFSLSPSGINVLTSRSGIVVRPQPPVLKKSAA